MQTKRKPERVRLGGDDQSGHRDAAAGEEPLQLLALVSLGAAEVDDLVRDHRGEAGCVRDEDSGVEDRGGSTVGRCQRRQRAGRVDHDSMLGERAEVPRTEPGQHHNREGDVRPEGPPPSPGRNASVGKQHDRERSQNDHRDPRRSERNGEPAQRQGVVDAIHEHRVIGCSHAHEHGECEREEDPADRVPWPTADDEQADDGEGERDDPDTFQPRARRNLLGRREIAGHKRREQADDAQRDGRDPRHSHDRIQTVTCAGSSDPLAAVASSSRTVSTSTASRRLAPKAATVASAS